MPAAGDAAQRHEPNEIPTPGPSVAAAAPSAPAPATGGVVMVLGGRRESSGGQTRRSPISTSYAVVVPGVSPSTTTSA
ncbi:hypothetical protein SMICM17S_06748 [Streptomyces microflavus]